MRRRGEVIAEITGPSSPFGVASCGSATVTGTILSGPIFFVARSHFVWRTLGGSLLFWKSRCPVATKVQMWPSPYSNSCHGSTVGSTAHETLPLSWSPPATTPLSSGFGVMVP